MSQEPDRPDWDEILLAAFERAGERQFAMVERFRLADGTRYRWSLADARITWSRDGAEFLSGRITMIGSVSASDGSFLWSWANPTLPQPALGEIDRVRRYGEANGFPLLMWESFHNHGEMVNAARQVSAAVLDAEGLWTDTKGDIQLHFLIHELTPLDRAE